jgi:transcriptional regulator with XRE-family HTH domain
MAGESTFGGAIADHRKRRGMSVARAAALSGVSATGLLRIESDERSNPKLSTLVGLAEGLNIKVVIDPEGVVIEDLEEA